MKWKNMVDGIIKNRDGSSQELHGVFIGWGQAPPLQSRSRNHFQDLFVKLFKSLASGRSFLFLLVCWRIISCEENFERLKPSGFPTRIFQN
ncbi:MAG: hypothetical protein GY714_29620 [Desulfobacterales bacterium]|nr:hypothetical protein [Desulfobacterales bacterium]